MMEVSDLRFSLIVGVLRVGTKFCRFILRMMWVESGFFG